MQQRQITLEDGRYLIFYTFDDEAAQAGASAKLGDAKEAQPRAAEPQPEPQAEEERRV